MQLSSRLIAFIPILVLFSGSLASAEPTPTFAAKRAAATTHTGEGTWFDPGLGACGYHNTSSQAVVALDSQIYGSGGNCLQWIKITSNGKTAYGQTLDECPGCPSKYSLDLSPSLFEKFASLDVGVIDISWNFEPFGFVPPSF